MNQWKRVLVMAAVLGGTFTAGVYSQDVLQRVDAYLRPDFNIVLNGTPVQMANPTLIYQDSSYLPVKELGNLLGANIIFKDHNRTIYINSRINPEQPVEQQDLSTDEFMFHNPYSTMVNYLGADYPVLLTYAKDAKDKSLVYYRLSDIRRMGIDTSGLKQSKEQLTGELYVSSEELQRRIKQLPTQSRIVSGERYVITDEVNTHRLEAIRNYINDTMNQSYENKDYVMDDDITMLSKPITVDRLDENSYRYLFMMTNYGKTATTTHYISATLVLEKMEDGSDGYTINQPARTDLTQKLEHEKEQRLLEQISK
ncbi:hypothetical protein [Paenibacillus xerothermodurans]|uniref:Copper amine oxidase-like N-terminal domain-containing protein n=1 Tax=Paenibacillus xerothermodurans TaxID=1977292 RepID=A0A2W1NF35_PAEXE|nr:hypothetical protein [Paenibacillus xerothermodurans]PZE22574.1 hypothetical protein CBW46_001995 [Paenibacillus xerothermodurans]